MVAAMTRAARRHAALGAALVPFALVVNMPSASAKDYGQQGAVFRISEPDLLRTIEQKLRTLEASGGIERMNAELTRRTEAGVRRPRPVVGIALAVRERSWIFDPTMQVDKDILDNKGNVIARAGQRVNPLDFVTVRQKLVFIDGDDRDQVNWALGRFDDRGAKLIMVKGAPLDAMTAHQRRFYFDQGGFLVGRFGIRAVPAVVEPNGKTMRVSEIPLGVGRK